MFKHSFRNYRWLFWYYLRCLWYFTILRRQPEWLPDGDLRWWRDLGDDT